MPILYTIKHVSRSWKLFLALLIGIMLASTFFAGINLKVNETAKQTFYHELSRVNVDMEVNFLQLNASARVLVISYVALFATANTVLIASIVGSRMIYGMAKDAALPKVLSKINKRTRTQWVAIALMMVF
jgi:amino acid transporter